MAFQQNEEERRFPDAPSGLRTTPPLHSEEHMPAPPDGAQASLLVYPDQVGEAISIFTDAANKIAGLLQDGQYSLLMSPMADDEVSQDAADGFTSAGTEGQTSHIAAMLGYQRWLEDIARKLQISSDQYRISEQARTAGMQGGPA